MVRVASIPQGPDTFSILLTTDNHVGVYEDDPIRSDDGWKTWHEITDIAVERDVDMIVQGGDLFHINKPSKKLMYQVMKLIRANCFGDRPVEFEMVLDPSTVFTSGFNHGNYEDANINVSVPIFAILGNHDDATGDGLLSPMDVLAISGMVNHFGKVENNEKVVVLPLLLEKGSTKLALYGLQSIRDERLHRSFRDGNVQFQRPLEHTNDWFNLFCIHQNHAQHLVTSHIPESFLPTFLDFVLWGHEHECIPNPVPNPMTEFDVLQAGLSIATLLAEGELAEKHVFVLNVRGKDYSIEAIPLTTVRPFLLKTISLDESGVEPGPSSKQSVVEYLTNEVEAAIDEANREFLLRNHLMAVDAPLPLIRLKVEYSGGYEIENTRRFLNRFVGKVANVNDIIHFYKRRVKTASDTTSENKRGPSPTADAGKPEINLEHILHQMLLETQLALLPEKGMDYAVKKYLETEDKHVLHGYIGSEIKQEAQHLLGIELDTDQFHKDDNHLRKVFKQVLQQIKKEQAHRPLPCIEVVGKKPPKKRAPAKRKSAEYVGSDSDSDIEEVATKRVKNKQVVDLD